MYIRPMFTIRCTVCGLPPVNCTVRVDIVGKFKEYRCGSRSEPSWFLKAHLIELHERWVTVAPLITRADVGSVGC